MRLAKHRHPCLEGFLLRGHHVAEWLEIREVSANQPVMHEAGGADLFGGCGRNDPQQHVVAIGLYCGEQLFDLGAGGGTGIVKQEQLGGGFQFLDEEACQERHARDLALEDAFFRAAFVLEREAMVSETETIVDDLKFLSPVDDDFDIFRPAQAFEAGLEGRDEIGKWGRRPAEQPEWFRFRVALHEAQFAVGAEAVDLHQYVAVLGRVDGGRFERGFRQHDRPQDHAGKADGELAMIAGRLEFARRAGIRKGQIYGEFWRRFHGLRRDEQFHFEGGAYYCGSDIETVYAETEALERVGERRVGAQDGKACQLKGMRRAVVQARADHYGLQTKRPGEFDVGA